MNKIGKTAKSVFEADKSLIEIFEMTQCGKTGKTQIVNLYKKTLE